MSISLSRASLVSLASVAVATATVLSAASPASAHARDHHKDKGGDISVTITIENDSDNDLKLFKKATGLSYGEWTDAPPKTVEESDEETFGAESNSKKGVEGVVAYRSDGSKEWIQISFKNPKKGDSEFDCDSSADLTCDVDTDDDDPDEVELTVNVSDS
jgi:hypothetical protein